MRIPDAKIAEVAAAADIVDVISGYVDLKRAGKDFRGLCPFHGDKDPSFYVSPQKEIFHCFGCAAGGSVFSFLMKMEGISFVEAVRTLAHRYGVPFDFEYERMSARRGEKERLANVLAIGHQYFRDRLHGNGQPNDYLRARGLTEGEVDQLGLGFAPDSWDGLSARLHRERVEPPDAVAAGLIRARESGGHYDYFRSRIMIPIRNLNGQVVAFGGRILGQGEPKYLNSPESCLFRKKETLYGLDAARDAIRREGFVVLVEGYFDQISLRLRGMENVVAPLGTALGREQVKLVKRFTDGVVTIFDADEAGVRAAKRAIPLFLAEGLEPKCVILRDYKDPDEAVNAIGIDGFRGAVDAAIPMIDFVLDSVESQYDLGTLQGRNLALEECIPVLREIADSKERDYLLERFSSRLRIKEERIYRRLRSGPRGIARNGPSERAKRLFDFAAGERDVVRGMLLSEGFIDRVIESGVAKDLEDPLLKRLALDMIEFRQVNGSLDAVSFTRSLQDETIASLVAGWQQPRREEDDLRTEVDGDVVMNEALDRIRLRKLRKRREEIKERMKHCAPGDDEYNILAQELTALRRRFNT